VSVAAITFVLVFLTEVADTSGLVTLVLAARFPPRWVLLGVCLGMVVNVAVALVAGGLLSLLPRWLLAAVLALVFLVGAYLIWREGEEDDDDDDEAGDVAAARTRWGVVATAFGVAVLSEFADPSQIVTASLAARYAADLLAVGVGATLGFWACAALAVWGGDRLRRVIPVVWVTRVAAAVMVGLAVWTAVDALRA
jgi:putative Ca2+/H+ antiporter (TMEM165/GDT1 family)